MIGYGKGKIILKFPPFFRLNEENKERENSKHQIKTKSFCLHLNLNFLLLIFLVQSEERREFQNNFSFSVPYHIQPWAQIIFGTSNCHSISSITRRNGPSCAFTDSCTFASASRERYIEQIKVKIVGKTVNVSECEF